MTPVFGYVKKPWVYTQFCVYWVLFACDMRLWLSFRSISFIKLVEASFESEISKFYFLFYILTLQKRAGLRLSSFCAFYSGGWIYPLPWIGLNFKVVLERGGDVPFPSIQTSKKSLLFKNQKKSPFFQNHKCVCYPIPEHGLGTLWNPPLRM